MKKTIYLDYMATTPVDARVAEKMFHYLTIEGDFGNPASRSHNYGKAALIAVDSARQHIAALVNADPKAIIFTSGATESINLAIRGAAKFYQQKGRHIITSMTEHKAVLDTCQALEEEGYEITYLRPLPSGLIDLNELQLAIRRDTLLISIMQANNEIGVIQDIEAIGNIARQTGTLLHVDAAQSVGKVVIDLARLPVDLMSFSAHKLYGPKGIGALYVRRKPRVRLTPLIYGGGHEQGLRSGTLATHQIVGMGEAFRLAAQEMPAEALRLCKLRERFLSQLTSVEGILINGDLTHRLPGNLNFSVVGVDGEALIDSLTGIAVSSGSACISASLEPSHVIRALGRSDELANASLRVSFGRFTTEAEIDTAAQEIVHIIKLLRTISPLWTGDRYQMPELLALQLVGDIAESEDVARASVGGSHTGNAMQVSLRVNQGLVVEAKYMAYGSLQLIKSCEFATQWVIGRSLSEMADFNHQIVVQALGLPKVKLHCALMAEDVVKLAIKNNEVSYV